jgi:hypothetical protein
MIGPYEFEDDRGNGSFTVYEWRKNSYRLDPEKAMPVTLFEIGYRNTAEDDDIRDFLRAAVDALNEKAALSKADDLAGAFKMMRSTR